MKKGQFPLHLREDPFAVLYETAHFGKAIGIVDGTQNRDEVISLIKKALETPYNLEVFLAGKMLMPVCH